MQVDAKGPVKFAEGKITDDKGRVLVYLDDQWKWERQRAIARLTAKTSATLAAPAKPGEMPAKPGGTAPLAQTLAEFHFTAASYAEQREICAKSWRTVLSQAMNVETPEPVVNNAWRHLLIQNFELMNGDRMHYSAGNQYDGLYEAEGSDAALAMMVWGYERDMRRLMPRISPW